MSRLSEKINKQFGRYDKQFVRLDKQNGRFTSDSVCEKTTIRRNEQQNIRYDVQNMLISLMVMWYDEQFGWKSRRLTRMCFHNSSFDLSFSQHKL